MTDFKSLNLSSKILQSLEKKGYKTPTPIQKDAIPHLLEGKDLLGIAQTGTGKTAAFSLPILNNLSKTNNKVKANHVRALILTPTRELASQIADNIDRYGDCLDLNHIVVFGGVAVNPQIRNLKKGVDILIATPGRLLDLMNQGQINYAQLEILVLDEADRMLDMGFINDVKKIISKLPKKRQNLLFSATMPSTIFSLANSILNNPIKVEVTPAATTVEKIDQKVTFVPKAQKISLLIELLNKDEAKTVLVFSKTKHGANKIVKHLLDNDIESAAIHGNKKQGAREKALDNFRTGKNKVLVATDIAARGIDVPNITHVVNFDIPHDPESYVHRIGRTARAGKTGVAVSFCDPSEVKLLRSVEKVIKYKIPAENQPEFKEKPAVNQNNNRNNNRTRNNTQNKKTNSSDQEQVKKKRFFWQKKSK